MKEDKDGYTKSKVVCKKCGSTLLEKEDDRGDIHIVCTGCKRTYWVEGSDY